MKSRSIVSRMACSLTTALVLPLLGMLTCQSAPLSTPVVSQVHVLSVHVQDKNTFDAVFLFLKEVLQLPLVFGTLSKPGNDDKTLYAGFSLGNAYLEPCGPYKNDAPFSPDRPARFHGLTFDPATSMDAAVKELGARNIPFQGPFGGWDMARFAYVSDPLLTSRLQAVSIWEIQQTNDHVNLGFLKSLLREADGGALGVRRLKEIQLNYPDKPSLSQWTHFLEPTKNRDGVWFAGDGPALRFVAGKESMIESIVLTVESLEKARAVLAPRNLIGKQTAHSIELKLARSFGLRIVVSEQ